MKRIIVITEQQAHNIHNFFTFSIDTLKTKDWKNGSELIQYCENCNLYKLGEGASRVVFQISDEMVLKIEKDKRFDTEQQNEQELKAFMRCDDKMKEFVPRIYDWDKKHSSPIWIISEQVLIATYADFQKILGIDFGSYVSSADITQMKQDMQDYSKYPGKTINRFSFNLMDFLESYGEDDIELYSNQIKNNPWLRELYTMLQNNIVCYWELENIQNWGLVKRNGHPKLIILDIGI